ncbi:hypothetical protein [Fodinicola feengrottensis]|uniref:hypothetical protein n=1 Tax=Fodinicola feengrottensis TaxID=435914 RepID=UPI0013D64E7C|nr:hypothetical protein [Fodinicola feengrottensis]
MVGVVGLVFLGGAWMYRQRTRQKLRMPTDTESRRIAAPLGRIAARHADLGILGPDLTDVILAGTAFGAYVNKAPLADGPDINPNPGRAARTNRLPGELTCSRNFAQSLNRPI